LLSLSEKFAFVDKYDDIVLITGHRRENFAKGFDNICKAIKQLAIKKPNICFVYPVHPNPNVQEPVNALLSGIENVKLIEPLDYLPFIYLMRKSKLILTDSGGIQEEASGLGKPVLVLRNTTERPEGVAGGTVKLVGTNAVNILNETMHLLDNSEAYTKMSKAHNPYGDGHAASRIIDIILDKMSKKK
jgi:UDP-N-acetylglucosamine 2-epimerase (non-hydrolysing)